MNDHPPANSAEFLARLADIMEAAPLDDAEVREALEDLALDPAGVAQAMGEAVRALDRQARLRLFGQAEADRREALDRLARPALRRPFTRSQMQARIRELTARAGAQVQAHFHRFELASDEDLARMLEEIEELVGNSEGDDS